MCLRVLVLVIERLVIHRLEVDDRHRRVQDTDFLVDKCVVVGVPLSAVAEEAVNVDSIL